MGHDLERCSISGPNARPIANATRWQRECSPAGAVDPCNADLDSAEHDIESSGCISPILHRLPYVTYYNAAAYDESSTKHASQRDRSFVHALMAEHPLMGPTQALLFRMVCFLRSCDYDDTDLRAMLVSASCYMDDVQIPLRADEITECFVLFVFLAHCYTQDECCPLFYWHRGLFQGYCTVPALNRGIFRLQKERDFVLRVDSDIYRNKDIRFPS
eukprot:GEMP01043615.1.p1 GENE.GEMP01043615.1~~GEMP01043615.1.p1  ORF type:complete len:216 (+),score=37.48 GEMP01043615.1:265-912(+)